MLLGGDKMARIPRRTIYRFLKEDHGFIQVRNDAVDETLVAIENYINKLAERAKTYMETAKRKSLMGEDIKKALETL